MTDAEWAEFSKRKKLAIEDITYPHEGPVTDFVMMYRAIELARAGKYPLMGIYDPVVEALHECVGKHFEHSGA